MDAVQTIWGWIKQNAAALSFFATLGTLLIWFFYAQLLLSSFRRQRRPRVIITQGWGTELDSLCIVSNMSEEAVYVLRVVLTVATDTDTYSESITDYGNLDKETPLTPARTTRQGPLKPGEYESIGTFRDLIEQLIRRKNSDEDLPGPAGELAIRTCEVNIIACTDRKTESSESTVAL